VAALAGPGGGADATSKRQWGEALFPKRYDALLNAVLRDVRAERAPGALEALFRRLGRQLAARDAHRFAGRPAAPGRGRA